MTRPPISLDENRGEREVPVDTRLGASWECISAGDGASPFSTDRLVEERYFGSYRLAIQVKTYCALRIGAVGFHPGLL